jgi:outer membrane protein assembly factor BamA
LGVSGPESEITGLVDLDLGNIAGTGRVASGRWENRGGGLTRFGLHYHEPWLPLVPISLDFDLAHDVNQIIYTYTRWALAASYTWRNQWSLTAGVGGAQAVEPAPGLGASHETFTLLGVGFDHRNSALNPTSGFRIYTESRRGSKTYPVADTLSVKVHRQRWGAGFEGYRRVGRPWLLSIRSRFDALQTPEAVVPRYELYAIGGASTLRGYREEQFLTSMAWVVQGEWSLLLGTQGSRLYLFTDVGFLGSPEARELGRLFDRVPVGTGVGVSQGSRFGILGVEYGWAKGENILDGRIHLRLDAMF